MRKSYQRKTDERIEFFTFITDCKILRPTTFRCELFSCVFYGFEIIKFSFFDTRMECLPTKLFLLLFAHFAKANAHETAQKTKNLFLIYVSQNHIRRSFLVWAARFCRQKGQHRYISYYASSFHIQSSTVHTVQYCRALGENNIQYGHICENIKLAKFASCLLLPS